MAQVQHMPQEAEYHTGSGNSLQSSAQDHCRSVSRRSCANSACALFAHPHLACQMEYRVPNALPGRGSVNVEIFGMAGVPDGAAPGITVPIGT